MIDFTEITERIMRCAEKNDAEHPRPACLASNPRCDGYGSEVLDDGVRECECVRMSRAIAYSKHKMFSPESRAAFLRPDATYNPKHPAMVIADEIVDCFRGNVERGLNRRIVLMSGPTGTGKTTATWIALGRLFRAGRIDSIGFESWRTMVRRFAGIEWDDDAEVERFASRSAWYINEFENIQYGKESNARDCALWLFEQSNRSEFYLFIDSNTPGEQFRAWLHERERRRLRDWNLIARTLNKSDEPILRQVDQDEECN